MFWRLRSCGCSSEVWAAADLTHTPQGAAHALSMGCPRAWTPVPPEPPCPHVSCRGSGTLLTSLLFTQFCGLCSASLSAGSGSHFVAWCVRSVSSLVHRQLVCVLLRCHRAVGAEMCWWGTPPAGAVPVCVVGSRGPDGRRGAAIHVCAPVCVLTMCARTFICAHVCPCMFMCLSSHVCSCVHMCVCTYGLVCAHTRASMCMCVCVHECARVCILNSNTGE